MQLDKMEAVIRPRSAWEAVDLGMLMATRWWWPMTKTWIVITLPCYLLLLLLPGESWIGPLVFWWLKPLWERIHLHIVSRALFGEVPGVLETCRAFPKLVIARLLPSLLWGRLNTHRAMDAPVMQLEGLRGRRYRQRIKLLHAEDDRPAPYLIFAGATAETLLFFSAVVLLGLLIPAELDSTLGQVLAAPEGGFAELAETALMYIAATLVAPFYVAGGFALYLNRRVKLEAWDLEIAFRNMAATRTRNSSGLAKVALLVLACALPLVPNDAGAQFVEPEAPRAPPVVVALDPDAVQAGIDDVMARDEFHRRELRATPEMDAELAATLSRWLDRLLEWFDADGRSDGGRLFAAIVEGLLWMTLFGIIAILLWHYRQWLRAFMPQRRTLAAPPRATHHDPAAMHVDPRNTALPDDVAGACKALWQQGHKLEAVALLYRASLVVFMRAHRVEFSHSATEGEHLALVRATLSPATAAWFMSLSRIWLFIAYGKRAPDEHELLALCDAWQQDWALAVQAQATSPQAGGGGAA